MGNLRSKISQFQADRSGPIRKLVNEFAYTGYDSVLYRLYTKTGEKTEEFLHLYYIGREDIKINYVCNDVSFKRSIPLFNYRNVLLTSIKYKQTPNKKYVNYTFELETGWVFVDPPVFDIDFSKVISILSDNEREMYLNLGEPLVMYIGRPYID